MQQLVISLVPFAIIVYIMNIIIFNLDEFVNKNLFKKMGGGRQFVNFFQFQSKVNTKKIFYRFGEVGGIPFYLGYKYDITKIHIPSYFRKYSVFGVGSWIIRK